MRIEMDEEPMRFRFDVGSRLDGEGLDVEKDTVEIIRTLPTDPTIELSMNDLEELARPPRVPNDAGHDDFWSVDVLVSNDDAIPDDEDDLLDLEHRGFIWRLLFRLGWVKLDDGPLAGSLQS